MLLPGLAGPVGHMPFCLQAYITFYISDLDGFFTISPVRGTLAFVPKAIGLELDDGVAAGGEAAGGYEDALALLPPA